MTVVSEARPISHGCGVYRVTIRILLRIVFVSILLVVLLAGASIGWLFWYKSDLPDIRSLAAFSPDAPTAVPNVNICQQMRQIIAVPARDLAVLRKALTAADGPADSRNMLRRIYDDVLIDPTRPQHGTSYSFQLSRQMLCGEHRTNLNRAFAELRTAIQVERHFSTEQLLNIYLNVAYFDNDVYGVESGALHYFGKNARQLSVSEAALLVGLTRSPSYYSPFRHPDRALARRNDVLDAMAQQRGITREAAEAAKEMPLGTIASSINLQH
jgi:penicillin-binding protein 1A